MTGPDWFKTYRFSPIIDLPENFYIHDFSKGADPIPEGYTHSVGRYNEVRPNMYTCELFAGHRNIHMGVDIAAPIGTAVTSFYDGEIAYFANNNRPGDYGPTLVTRHFIEGKSLFALYGHLSLESLTEKKEGQKINAGDIIGTIGSEKVNGGWFPHVHFQLSCLDPQKADMPGVVSQSERTQALKDFPDPLRVLGPLYT